MHFDETPESELTPAPTHSAFSFSHRGALIRLIATPAKSRTSVPLWATATFA